MQRASSFLRLNTWHDSCFTRLDPVLHLFSNHSTSSTSFLSSLGTLKICLEVQIIYLLSAYCACCDFFGCSVIRRTSRCSQNAWNARLIRSNCARSTLPCIQFLVQSPVSLSCAMSQSFALLRFRHPDLLLIVMVRREGCLGRECRFLHPL